jgi:hypothetical protein
MNTWMSFKYDCICFKVSLDHSCSRVDVQFTSRIKHGSRTRLKDHIRTIVNPIFIGMAIISEIDLLAQINKVIYRELQILINSGILLFDQENKEFFFH